MNRDRILDIVKGIAITAIVIGHLPRVGIVKRDYEMDVNVALLFFLQSFHIMVFFILAGDVVKKSWEKYSLRKFFEKRFCRLVIPYCSFVLLYALSIIIYNYISVILGQIPLYYRITPGNILRALIMSNEPYLSRMGGFGFFWFFPPYFLCNIIFFIILNIKREALRIPLLLCILPALFFSLTNILQHSYFPWGINIAFVVLPLMWVGTQYETIKRLLQKIKHHGLIMVMIAVHLSIILLFCPYIVLANCYTSSYVFFYVLAILGFSWVLLAAVNIVDLPLGKVFACIGRYTLPIYAMHMIVINYAGLLKDYAYGSYAVSFGSLVLTFVLSIVMPIIVTKKIVEKNRVLNFLFLGSA